MSVQRATDHGDATKRSNYKKILIFPLPFYLHLFYLQIFSVIVTILVLQCSALSNIKSASDGGAMDRQQLWPGNILRPSPRQLQSCAGGKGLKYISGDALADGTNCVGPNNQPYPK